MHKTYFK